MDDESISCRELAELLQLNPSRIRQLVAEGVLVKVGRNRFPRKASLDAYYRFKFQYRQCHSSMKNNSFQDPAADLEKILLSTEQLAQLFQLSAERIRQLEKEGIFIKEGFNSFPLKSNLERFLHHRLLAEKGEGDLRKRKLLVEIELKELELAKKKGEIISIDDVISASQEIVYAVTTQFRALPARMAAQLVGLQDPTLIQKLLQDRVYEILTDLSRLESMGQMAERGEGHVARSTEERLLH